MVSAMYVQMTALLDSLIDKISLLLLSLLTAVNQKILHEQCVEKTFLELISHEVWCGFLS